MDLDDYLELELWLLNHRTVLFCGLIVEFIYGIDYGFDCRKAKSIIIIVGIGAAGLAAASQLVQKHRYNSSQILILEAGSRIGDLSGGRRSRHCLFLRLESSV